MQARDLRFRLAKWSPAKLTMPKTRDDAGDSQVEDRNAGHGSISLMENRHAKSHIVQLTCRSGSLLSLISIEAGYERGAVQRHHVVGLPTSIADGKPIFGKREHPPDPHPGFREQSNVLRDEP